MMHFYCDFKKNYNYYFLVHLLLLSRNEEKGTLSFSLPVCK